MKHILETEVDNLRPKGGLNVSKVNQNSGFLKDEKIYDVHNLKALIEGTKDPKIRSTDINSSFHTEKSEFPVSTALYSPKNID